MAGHRRRRRWRGRVHRTARARRPRARAALEVARFTARDAMLADDADLSVASVETAAARHPATPAPMAAAEPSIDATGLAYPVLPHG